MFLNNRIAKLMALAVTVSLTVPVLAQDGAAAGAADLQQGRAAMFSRLDANADGAINYDEFTAIPLPSFEQQDSNGDGMVSRDEMLERRFSGMDADGNGLLSADELRGPDRDGRRGEGRRGDGEMRERMRNMTPEQRAQMRERMQNMTPEQRAAMREQMRQHAQSGGTPSGSSQSDSSQSDNAAHNH